MTKYLLLLVAIATLSCNSSKRLTKAEERLAMAGRLPAICSERYPIKADTTFLSDTIIKIDTFLSGEYIFDTIRVNDTVIDIEYKPLEIVKVKTLTKYIQVENTAQVRVLNTSVSQLQANRADLIKELGEYKAKAKTRLNWLILIICLILGWSVRKPVTNLIKWHLKV
jgi:hypothetical protein